MAEDNAGFTTKEILIRVETKVDIALADHEARLRKIEANDAIIEGGISSREKWGAKIIGVIALAIALASVSVQIYVATL